MLPNFLLIGVAKAGTTSLYHALRDHPDVFMPDLKEPRFFTNVGQEISKNDPVNKNTITSIEGYKKLFSEVSDESAIGEASVYFGNQNVHEKIHSILGQVKFVLILRNPIERAFSHFLFAKQKGFEPEEADFRSAIEYSKVQVGEWTRNRSYVEAGFYHRHLQRWLSTFERDQFKIILFEDFVREESRVVQEVYRFLGIDSSYEPPTGQKYAKSGLPKNNKLHRFLTQSGLIRRSVKNVLPETLLDQVRSWINPLRTKLINQNLEKPELPNNLYCELAERYSSDIEKLEDDLGRDLSHWVNPSSKNGI